MRPVGRRRRRMIYAKLMAALGLYRVLLWCPSNQLSDLSILFIRIHTISVAAFYLSHVG